VREAEWRSKEVSNVEVKNLEEWHIEKSMGRS